MIQVTLDYKGEDVIAFRVQGHAGFADSGEDIYCAGVSAVTQTALVGLYRHIEPKPRFHKEQGFLECTLPAGLNGAENQKAQIILSTMAEGLLLLAKDYTDYINVVVRRC